MGRSATYIAASALVAALDVASAGTAAVCALYVLPVAGSTWNLGRTAGAWVSLIASVGIAAPAALQGKGQGGVARVSIACAVWMAWALVSYLRATKVEQAQAHRFHDDTHG
jgi:hypothetical protein